ncbi:MAG: hypothetical protein ACI90V_000657 [Bacillariaceae sp.]|jgi:hypothetical protein
MEILQIEAIKTLLEHAPGSLPIACGGGGIPVARVPANPQTLIGVEAVIDKVKIRYNNYSNPNKYTMRIRLFFLFSSLLTVLFLFISTL